MANFLTSAGLATQGADAARNVQQDYEIGQSRLNAANQNAQLVGQQIETGQMGLEEAKRNRAQDIATRQAGASSIAGGNTMSGSLLDMANTEARAGRMQQALQYRQANQALEAMGGPEIVHAAITGQPGDRPDIVSIMNKYEATKGVTNATMDNAGKLIVTRNGQTAPIDVKQMGELLGIFKPAKMETIPAGGVGVMTGPGVDPTKAQNQIVAPKTFAENPQHGFQTVKDAEGGETLIDIRPTVDGKPNPDFKKPVTGGGAAGTSVRKDLHVLDDIGKAVADLGPEYATIDMNSLNPKPVPTKLGNQVMLIANQLRLGTKDSGQDLDPRTVVDIAAKGKAVPKYVDGKFAGNVVLYNGQEFPLRTAQGAAQPAPKPVPAPAPAPAAASAAPTAAPIAPESNSRAVNNQFAVGGVQEQPGARAAFDDRRAKERARTTYNLIVAGAKDKLYSPKDIESLQTVMKSGILTPAEMQRGAALLKASGVAGYARGGMVSRAGLG